MFTPSPKVLVLFKVTFNKLSCFHIKLVLFMIKGLSIHYILQESPTEIAGVVRNNMIRKARQSDFPAKRARTSFGDGIDHQLGLKSKGVASQLDIVSEFSSGLEKEHRKRKELNV